MTAAPIGAQRTIPADINSTLTSKKFKQPNGRELPVEPTTTDHLARPATEPVDGSIPV